MPHFTRLLYTLQNKVTVKIFSALRIQHGVSIVFDILAEKCTSTKKFRRSQRRPRFDAVVRGLKSCRARERRLDHIEDNYVNALRNGRRINGNGKSYRGNEELGRSPRVSWSTEDKW